MEGPPLAIPTIPFLRIGESRNITLHLGADVLPGSGGLQLQLSSSNPALSVPATVLVPEGERS
ncbi:MAG: hypothetical protein LR015_00400, partial [Verrucomicrobia bacterium]|nr:hypothetical protein [Verrucomicrobiota bacterium]